MRKRENTCHKFSPERGIPVPAALEVLAKVSDVVQVVDVETYAAYEEMARQRLRGRDLEDWPVLATALLLRCPIWTEVWTSLVSVLPLGPQTAWSYFYKALVADSGQRMVGDWFHFRAKVSLFDKPESIAHIYAAWDH